MERKKIQPASTDELDTTLAPLNIRQLEERLEVSSLVPGAHGQESNSAFIEIENCCNDKCSGNDIQVDDPIDTGEIVGGGR